MVAPSSWKIVLKIMLERGTVLIDSFERHLFSILHVLGTAVAKAGTDSHGALRILFFFFFENSYITLDGVGSGEWSFICILFCTSRIHLPQVPLI